MKTIIVSGIIALFCGIIQAEPWEGYSLQTDDGATPSFIGIIYQGQRNTPATEITEMSQKIDRSSPEALLKSWLWALNNVDEKVYDELFATNHLAQPFANDPTIKITKLTLGRKIQYGDISIYKLQIVFTNSKVLLPFTNTHAAELFPIQKRGTNTLQPRSC